MTFHSPKKKIIKPKIYIDNIEIEHVDEFNCLGIHFTKNMNWKSHTDKIASKISRSIGILNRLKRQLPMGIKITLYNTLILPHLNYGILLWGDKCERLEKLQKKAIRIITVNKYNAHTEPLFKSLNILKLKDMFLLNQLKFYYNFINNKLPHYFQQFQISTNL